MNSGISRPHHPGYSRPPGRTTALLIPIILLLIFPTGWASPMPAQDTVVMKNGRRAACEILSMTGDSVRVSYGPGGSTPAGQKLIPVTEVDYIEKAPFPGETEALAQAIRDGESSPLMIYWVKHLPWLGKPRTRSGETGLIYAELLTRVNTPDRMERALQVYSQIEAADWSPIRRGRAQAGRLRVMLRQGRAAEVRPQAEALLKENGDPRILIELHHVLAETAAAALTQLINDHPRWEQEEDVIPQRLQLLNDALDSYLYPHLFHGAEEDLAARGVWAAAALCAAHDMPAETRSWCEDILQLYQGSPEAAAATQWLQKQPSTPSQPANPPEAIPQDSPAGEEVIMDSDSEIDLDQEVEMDVGMDPSEEPSAPSKSGSPSRKKKTPKSADRGTSSPSQKPVPATPGKKSPAKAPAKIPAKETAQDE